MTTNQQRLWTVDECADAQGYWTIRPNDGTINGDTDVQPVATVYKLTDALQIVHQHNCQLADSNRGLQEEADEIAINLAALLVIEEFLPNA